MSEAKRRGVALCLIHSLDWIPIESAALPMGMPMPAVPPDLFEDLRASTREKLKDCLRRFGAEGEGIVGDGHAAAAIVRLAEQLPAELVVVGTRGRTGLARLTLGSVAEAVISMAPCSVLVVRLREG